MESRLADIAGMLLGVSVGVSRGDWHASQQTRQEYSPRLGRHQPIEGLNREGEEVRCPGQLSSALARFLSVPFGAALAHGPRTPASSAAVRLTPATSRSSRTPVVAEDAL